MLRISAEISSGRTVKGISSYCIPNYYGSRASPLAAARRLSKYCADITYTQVCRNIRAIAAARKALSTAAKVKSITTILAVTGDKAASSDISIFDLIRSIDRKRFKAAAAIVFTRKNEASRIAKKAAAGATIFYTQPVFGSNWKKLAATLKQLPQTKREVRIGVLIPFSAATCRAIAKEKPGLMTDSGFIAQLAAAEKKSAKAACAATIRVARENLRAALKTAAAVNKGGNTLKVTGIHFYGLTDRVFRSGKQKMPVPAAELLKKVLDQQKRQKTAKKT